MLVAALLLDALLGEPKKYHPLIGFGNFASYIERLLTVKERTKSLGLIAWLLAVVPITLGSWVFFQALEQSSVVFYWLSSTVALYLCIGGKSLTQHARWISTPMLVGDMDEAREKVGWIVSRNTADMDEYQITSATVESVLENSNDAVFGALFWFLVAGAPGAILFRLANTLDAMWGYKNAKYQSFGYCAAKLDDILGAIPARLTAMTFVAVGESKSAIACWRSQAHLCASPNGGPVMCSGAGALRVRIGGPAVYFGELKDKIFMGEGELACAGDIERAITLVQRSYLLWCTVLLALAAVVTGT
ncbi:cobalamin biosynthesis protein [Vibrio sp. SCSIO 43136]|nr:cobalamin biosynthesis protein [Vibrio sp. SCSIO 43136]